MQIKTCPEIKNLLPLMYDHQMDAVNKFARLSGSLRLVWETGAGKTFAFLACYLYSCIIEQKMLQATIVCPKVLIDGMWIPTLTELDLIQHFSIVNYEMVLRHPDLINGEFLILDEDHRISNSKSKTGIAIKNRAKELRIKYRIGGTGTPEPRSYVDHYLPLSIYYEDDFTNVSAWQFASKYGKFNSMLHKFFIHPNKKQALMDDIAYYCHSVRLADCYELPEIIYKPVSLKMPPEQKAYYEELGLEQEKRFLLTGLQRAMIKRKACSDYWDEEEETAKTWNGKLTAILDILPDIEPPVIIWGHFRHENIKTYEAIKQLGHKVALWIGETDKNINEWNDGKIDYVVANPAAVGIGLNLQRCSNVIYSSVDWGIINYLQSLGRVKRIGQKKNICLHHVFYSDTIETEIWKRLKQKEIRVDEIINFIKLNT